MSNPGSRRALLGLDPRILSWLWMIPLGSPPAALCQEVEPEPRDEAERAQDVELPPQRVTPLLDEFEPLEPGRVERQSFEQLWLEGPPRILPDALLDSPGVGLQRTGPGQVSPFLRGFTGFRTAFVLDGFRFTHAAWREGPNQYLVTIDADLIDELVVLPGAGAVAHGLDGIGGTVLMRSKPAGPSDPEREHDGLVSVRLASAEHSAIVHGEAGGRLGPDLLYRVGVTRRSFGDLDGGRHVGEQPGTAYESGAGDAKVTWLLADNSVLTFAHQVDRQVGVPRTHRTEDAIVWRNLTQGDERKRDLDQRRDFTYAWLQSTDVYGFDEVSAGLGRHLQEEDQFRIRNDGRSDEQGFQSNAVLFTVSAARDVEADTTRVGLDLGHERVTSYTRNYAAGGAFTGDSIQGPVGDDSDVDQWGVFAEQDWWWSDSWLLEVGGRVHGSDLESDRVEDPETGRVMQVEDHWWQWAASVRVLRLLPSGWSTWLAASRSARLPNLSDLTRFDTARTGEIETPSPGLDPERFQTLEIGLRHSDETWDAEVAVYHTWIRDLIVRFPTGRIVAGSTEVTKANASDGRMFGADLRGEVLVCRDWTAGVMVSYVAGRGDTFLAPGVATEEPLSKLPPLRGGVSLRWDDPERPLWVEGRAILASEQDRLSLSDEGDTSRIPPGGTPGYTVLGLRGGCQPTERLTLTLAIENLTNEDYRLHGSGVNEPGTNVVLSALWRF